MTQPRKTLLDSARLGLVNAINSVRQGLLAAMHALLFRQFRGQRDSVSRILIFRIGNVGDVVAATPVLSGIRQRFPKAHICLLTSPGAPGSPGAAELIRPGSMVDSLIVYHKSDIANWESRKRLVHRIRRERFELFVELSNILAPFRQVAQSMAVARLAGCRYAVGLLVAESRWFPRTQALHVPFPQESQRLWNSVGPDLDLSPNGPGRLPVTDADKARVRTLLQKKGLRQAERIVVMHIGAKRSANRWFEDRYAAVADWVQANSGNRVVFTGASSDHEQIEHVLRHMRTEPIVACGQLSLLETAALLEQASLYVGNDTGPMHIAAAMETPAVAIFSARDFPNQWYPHGNQHLVIRRDVPCSPCFKDECDRGLICLDRIQVDDVIQAIQLQLSKPEQLSKPAQGGFLTGTAKCKSD